MLNRGQFFGGSAAVCFFFVLSGFLITHSFHHSGSTKIFLIKRALRLYPGYVAAALFGSLIIAPITIGFRDFYSDFSLVAFIQSVFLLQGPAIPPAFITNPYAGEVNGSLWTIKHEAVAYLAAAALGYLGFLRKGKFIWACFLVVCTFHFMKVLKIPVIWSFDKTFYPTGRLLYNFTFLTYFFSGSLIYLYRDKIKLDKTWAFISGLIVLLSFYKYLELTLPIFGSYLIIYFGRNPAPGMLKFTNKTDLSYGIYVHSFIIQQSLLFFLPDTFRSSPYLLCLATFPIVFGMAYLSWNVIEKRFLQLKTKL